MQEINNFFLSTFKLLTILIFLAIVPILFFYDFGTTLVWTILIPIIPVGLLIIGFSRWREICPLAFISKISQNIDIFPKHKVPQWFETNFWYFQYFLLFLALVLRLTTLNYDSSYLGIFFIIVVLSAFLSNLFFTGKSWCNFFCPVAPVEKIYTLSNAKNYSHNSACGSCTACKQNCPDIDMENNYWRESVNKQKSSVFYSFPGLVLGFYLYFYLQSGTMEYYFLGSWTADTFSLLSAGFYFASYIPVVIAVPATLIVFSLISYYLFYLLERLLWKQKIFKDTNYETVLHRVKTLASFLAFNIFYAFAGAPTYMHYPVAYGIFYFVVVVASSALFYKEIFREQSYFVQERFALKILKKLNTEKPIHGNLKEIYYTYMNENKDKKEKLLTYRSTIKDLMQEGILNDGSVIVLEKLREQIGITEKEHFDTMRDLRLKHEDLFDDTIEKSTEKKYQRSSYQKMIEEALVEHFELDAKYIKSLQKQFGITDEIHKSIMDTILNSNDKLHADVLNLLNELYKLLKIKNSLLNDHTREVSFLKYSIKNEFNLLLKDLFSLLFVIYKENTATLRILLDIAKEKQVDPSFKFDKNSLSFMDDEIASKIMLLKSDFDIPEKEISKNNNQELIRELLSHTSIEIAGAALLNIMLTQKEYLASMDMERFNSSIDKGLISLLHKISNNTDETTTLERMMYLNSVTMFQNMDYLDMKTLAQSTNVISFTKDEYIIREGDIGTTLFIIIKGEALAELKSSQTAKLGDTDYVGEIAILGDIKRTASVKAVSDVTTLTISKEEFKKFIYEHPKVSMLVMKDVINKLVETQS